MGNIQFLYPNVLWALLLLGIPIIVHLFKLRRFKKTPFTNVKFLEKVVSETNKTSQIKKWLLLISRLGMLTFLILAFAQPFTATESALVTKEYTVYLDNSFSMEAPGKQNDLLQEAIQDLAQHFPQEQKLSFFTNDQTYRDVSFQEIRSVVLQTTSNPEALNFEDVLLKAQTLFSKHNGVQKELILISDFQGPMTPVENDSTTNLNVYTVPKTATETLNVSIDSLYVLENGPQETALRLNLQANGAIREVGVTVQDGDRLLAKSLLDFEENSLEQQLDFKIKNGTGIQGQVSIRDGGLPYDNQLFFSTGQSEKIKVLHIQQGDADYLDRIYDNNTFTLTKTALDQLNYSALYEQNFVFLQGLERIPNTLVEALIQAQENGTGIGIIPPSQPDLASYDTFLTKLGFGSLDQQLNDEQEISSIRFNHPLFKGVFEKNEENFQFPKTNGYLKLKSPPSTVIGFSNGSPFLSESNGVYFFHAPLNPPYSNFSASPLIVPTLYNMGWQSIRANPLYTVMTPGNYMDIGGTYPEETIISLTQEELRFIPRQQYMGNKIRLFYDENPQSPGLYQTDAPQLPAKTVAYNYARSESLENNAIEFKGTSSSETVAGLIELLNQDNRINQLWKWFLIVTLCFVILEVLIQKLIK
ncbi:BatA domain-containing protein [Sediminicola luteus]|uniref:Aerotolerance regulator N-terminal domain-containing protein n=1 Tax=Sediminicola luteus TaxID=319238 RepID=A0A2A4G7W5_9FLAO|nr:BatA domain-containing protein [Sediminicola luteus]PCE63842.1 hypothetical protein B7P33_11265 [Sediminicola luteus]